MSDKKMLEKISKELEQLGGKAYEIAREAILNEEKINYEPLREAINYFIDLWRNFQHPTLLAVACKAVGGEPEKTTLIGAALVLMTGAADIHDDIIDKSKVKGSKATLYGKFGKDLSILVGDALLFEGLTLLNEACKELTKEQADAVQELVKQGFYELGTAEAKEASLKGRWDLSLEEYLDIIRKKAAVAEATARIGAVIGCATSMEIEEWGKIGRILGMLVSIRNEFVDVFETRELMNRRDNECLPLPLLYAMRNPKAKKEIIRLLKKKKLAKDDAIKIATIILKTEEVQRLKTEIQNLIKELANRLSRYKINKEIEVLNTIAKLTLSDL